MSTKPKIRFSRPALAGYLAGLTTAVAAFALMVAFRPPAPATPAAIPAATPTVPAATPAAGAAQPLWRPTAATTTSGGPSAVPQHAGAPLSDAARSRAVPLRARLEAQPDDLTTRKQLAVLLVQNRQLMEAYEHASRILAVDSDDIDGLYVQGVVRLAMGQGMQALVLFERVLAQRPDHALALRGKDEAERKIQERGGHPPAGRPTRSPSGNNAGVQELIAAANDGTLEKMMRSDGEVE